jgi:hypothetical protein
MQALADFLLTFGLQDVVTNTDWIWPVCETLHFVSMALLIGTVGAVDLRILGLGKGLSIAALERFVPIGVAAFAVNALTGFVFVAGNPEGGPMFYLTNLSFQIKMTLVLVAGINLLVFYGAGIARTVHALGPSDSAPINAKVIAAVSLVAWFSVILFGRLLMYNDTLLYALGL